MKIAVITPAFNEEEYISKTIESLTKQTVTPDLWIIVDDGSSDATFSIAEKAAKEYSWIEALQRRAKKTHQPGGAVIEACKEALKQISLDSFDIICKFDADLEFPPDYLEQIVDEFNTNPMVGICGGVCTVPQNGQWVIEKNNKADHIRGALKSWRVSCFKDIGGLKSGVGWDTIDELLARYHNWEVKVIRNAEVRHHKPTFVKSDPSKINRLFGRAYYQMGYGPIVGLLSSLKHAGMNPASKRFIQTYFNFLKTAIGPTKTWTTKSQARFIRKYRYRSIFGKH